MKGLLMKKILYVASVASHLRSFHIPYINALRADGYEVVTLAAGEGADISVPFKKKFFDRGNRAARKIIKDTLSQSDFDAIVLNTSLAAFHTRLALGRSRPRVVNIVHGYLFPLIPPKSLASRIKRRMLILAERLVAGRTDRVIVMNSEDMEIAKKYRLSGGDVRLCHGMGVKATVTAQARPAVRERLGMSERFVILFAGELSDRKNQRQLISLLPEIIKSIPNAELWLLGEGDAREGLKEYAQALGVLDRVKLLGRREDARDFMSGCDVYISAASSEGLPFNIVEALASGAYTVASDVKGHRDILPRENLFSLGDSERAVSLVLRARDITPPCDSSRKAAESFLFDTVFYETYSLIKGGIECLEE